MGRGDTFFAPRDDHLPCSMAAASGAAASPGGRRGVVLRANARRGHRGGRWHLQTSPSQTRIVPTPSTVSSKRTHEVSPRSPVSATCDAGNSGTVDRAFFSSRKDGRANAQKNTPVLVGRVGEASMINAVVEEQRVARVAHHGDAVLPQALRHWLDGGDCRAGTPSARSRR